MTDAEAAGSARRAGPSAPRVAVVGCHGYGARHVHAVLRLQQLGRARLVGLVDPRVAPVVLDGRVLPTEDLPRFHPTLEDLVAELEVDVVVVASPLQHHAEQAATALAAGADVLLEKPPVTSRSELRALLAAESRSPGVVQVGFQALGSSALTALEGAVAAGALGEVTAVGAHGSWTRDRAYYQRARWAGRRHLDGRVVLDGSATNPFAHALADALRLSGRTAADGVGAVDVELYRAHDIEADDTSSLRIGPGPAGGGIFGGDVMAAFTLAGPREDEPVVVVRGSRGAAHLFYASDRVEVEGDVRPDGLAGVHPRRDLLEDLLARRQDGRRVLSPLASTAGLVEVMEAVGLAQPRSVADEHVRWVGRGAAGRPVLEGVDRAVREVVRTGRLFSEGGAPWT